MSQDQALQFFQQKLEQVMVSGRLPGAILVTGATLDAHIKCAQHLVFRVLGVDAKNQALCQSPDGHPDVVWLRPEGDAGQIKIEAVRALKDFVSQTAFQGGARVVVIVSAERLNLSAANALLKALEEPPPGLVFLLLTQTVDRLLPTVRSRCQVWALPRLALQETSFCRELSEHLNRPFDPLELAARYQRESLPEVLNALCVFVMNRPEGLSGKGQAFLDRCLYLKGLLHRQINVNVQLQLESLLIDLENLIKK